MRQIIILILTVILFCSCAPDRHRKWMVVVEPLGKPADTIYVEGGSYREYRLSWS